MTFTQKAVEAAAEQIDYEAFVPDADGSLVPALASRRSAAIVKAERTLTAALAVDGLCLVPKEPTMAMLYAGERAWIDDPLKRSSTLYRAMLAAANDGEERK